MILSIYNGLWMPRALSLTESAQNCGMALSEAIGCGSFFRKLKGLGYSQLARIRNFFVRKSQGVSRTSDSQIAAYTPLSGWKKHAARVKRRSCLIGLGAP
jgi:hypothetical protein